ncbi:MAG: alpha/beta hydrolase fold domain-containing protein [Treponemataceae bacterium]
MSDCGKIRRQLKRLVYSKKLTAEQSLENYKTFFNDAFLPNQADCSNAVFAGKKTLIITPVVKNAKNCVLYFHGGFFHFGSQKAYMSFAASLANACQGEVILPEITPATKKAFPSQLEEAYALYQSLLQSSEFANYDFVFAGDGTGANLCLALALYLKDKNEKLPLGLSLISPLVKMETEKAKLKDALLTNELLEIYIKNYLGEKDARNPLISPVFADEKNLQDLPKIFIQVGKNEFLFAQTKDFIAKLENANVPYELQSFLNTWHMFQLFPDHCDQAHIAIEHFAKKIMEIFSGNFGKKNDKRN